MRLLITVASTRSQWLMSYYASKPTIIREVDYLHYEAILYPHCVNEHMAPIWIVNLQIDSIREEYPSDQVKLPVGSLLYLHDSNLTTHLLGFEQHAVFGMILDGRWSQDSTFFPSKL